MSSNNVYKKKDAFLPWEMFTSGMTLTASYSCARNILHAEKRVNASTKVGWDPGCIIHGSLRLARSSFLTTVWLLF